MWVWCVFSKRFVCLGGGAAPEGPVGPVVVVFLHELVDEVLEFFDGVGGFLAT